jgi:hypothetical protein
MTVVVRGSIRGNGPAFNAVRIRMMMRDTAKESGDKLQDLVRKRVAKFSDTGTLWKSIEKSKVRRVAPKTWEVVVFSDLEYAAAVEYGWAPRKVEPTKRAALQWGDGAGIQFSKGHYIGGFSGHHMFQKAKAEFERLYAEDIAEDNARIWLGTLDAGRKTFAF